ncbi:exodeoxyribonuclease VII small subunit [Vreelandella subglaciescola]|uniref:Exodeoxyribonuclease 7 small subunit n=1 Tax=Vreelandella subglaciescola TaxID=29571 RepID=A0A1M7GWE2_9GAMM|nr:exodeoxyribonuclease VII small subunit [Halomonas subglaciescola]SHM20555.1 Exodeoxyribonuclease VII small subunit [Halomonas subglaciescola]
MSDTETSAQDFATTVEQLESLVERLETGALSLEDSLTAFEQGVRLARQAQTRLDDAELKVRALSEDGAGGLEVTPFAAPDDAKKASKEGVRDSDSSSSESSSSGTSSQETPPW